MAEKEDLSATHEEALSKPPQDTPFVVKNSGETAKLDGVQTKTVYNVSFHLIMIDKTSMS
jgi:hypothetical protein